MIKNYFSLITAELVSRAISFFWIVYMARHLGVADYGTYSTVLAVIAIATSFLDLGVHYIIVRENVKNPELTPKFLGAQISLRFIFGFSSLIIFGFIMHGSDFTHEMKILVFLAGLHMLFHNIGMVGDTVFSVYNKQYLIAVMHTVHGLGWAILGYLSLRFNGSLHGLLLAMVANSLMICVIYMWLVFTKFAKPDFHLPLPFVTRLLKAAIPIGLTGVFAILFQRVDRILISHFCGDYQVGLYSAAMTLIGPVGDLVWSSAIIVLYPYMASLYEDADRFHAVFRNILLWLFAIFLAAVLLFVAFPDRIIGLAFGKKFVQSTYVLGILALQLIPLPFHGFFGRILMIRHKQKEYCIANFAALVSNLLLNLVLIPRWNILGAGIATVLTNSVLIFYYGFFSGLSILDFIDLKKVFLTLTIGLAAIVLAQKIGATNLFFGFGTFAIIYLTLIYWALDFGKECKRTLELLNV